MDSLIYFLNNKPRADQAARLYYLGRTASRHDIFNYNNRTIDQMRNSGGFRLVHSQEISNLIMGYYRQIKLLEMLEGIGKNEEQEYRKSAIRVFDPVIFNSMITDKDSVVLPIGNPALRTEVPDILIDLSGWVQYIKSTVLGLTESKRDLEKSAEELISSIKKEYHLE